MSRAPPGLHSASFRRKRRGFTLVEVLIAVSLATLVLAGLGSTLYAFGMASARIDQALSRIEALRMVPAFLRTSLGALADAAQFEGVAARGEGFYGARGELRWIGTLPGRHGAGGLHHLRLYVDRRADAPALAIQYQPFEGSGRLPDWGRLPPHLLVARLDAFLLAYRKPSPGAWEREPEWLDVWPHSGRLPEAVRISITADGVAWPPLVVPLRPVPADADGADALHHGMPS